METHFDIRKAQLALHCIALIDRLEAFSLESTGSDHYANIDQTWSVGGDPVPVARACEIMRASATCLLKMTGLPNHEVKQIEERCAQIRVLCHRAVISQGGEQYESSDHFTSPWDRYKHGLRDWRMTCYEWIDDYGDAQDLNRRLQQFAEGYEKTGLGG